MKKKCLILPSVMLVIAVLAGAFMMVFTTSFVFNLKENYSYACCSIENNFGDNLSESENTLLKSYADCYRQGNELFKIIYKINPNFSNLSGASNIYNTNTLLLTFNEFENGLEEVLKVLPEDYPEQCLKWNKTYYEYVKNNYNEFYNNQHNSLGAFDAYPVCSKENIIIQAKVGYLTALYLNGQKEEAQKEVEEILRDYKDIEPNLSSYFISEFVFLVHNVETDKAYQEWMLSKEYEFTQIVNSRINDDKYGNFYEEFEVDKDSYKPFN